VLHVVNCTKFIHYYWRGGSGGAIALASSNKVIMLENSIYSVISPEGCASILWRDPSKSLQAAEAMKLTAKDLLKTRSYRRDNF
jgi:acetyl-CoA carboxylase carboxyl transferase subunit alpha